MDRDYRSEMVLTVALMGLIAEDNLIVQKLSPLGHESALDPAAAGEP
jgi:hypothetical protein